MLDFDGGGCVGTVERVEGWYACVKPDWKTWTGGELPKGAGPGDEASAAAPPPPGA